MALLVLPVLPVGRDKANGGKANGGLQFPDGDKLTPTGGVKSHGRSDAVLTPGGVRIGTAVIYRLVELIAVVQVAICMLLTPRLL